MTTLLPTPQPERQKEPLGPSLPADCVADSAGGLTFDIPDPGTGTDAHLLLKERTGADHTEEVRLPLAPAADGRLRAALPSSVPLAEGRWDAYAQVAGDARRRLVPGLLDLRALVDREVEGTLGQVAVRIPYTTKHGNLTVRSWWRAPHAEAGDVQLTEGRLGVSGRLYGVRLGTSAHAELRGRHSTKPVVRAGLQGEGRDFTLSIGYAELAEAAGAGVWDLWLLPEGEPGPRVRLARLLDDVADRKPVHVYPAATLQAAGGRVSAMPYYTLDNDLSVTVNEG